jgi:hypothetical protein
MWVRLPAGESFNVLVTASAIAHGAIMLTSGGDFEVSPHRLTAAYFVYCNT